jgi:hypothetical protein
VPAGATLAIGLWSHNLRMKMNPVLIRFAVPLALGLSGGWAAAQSVYYVCPGNVFTNTITAKEAESRGCKSREARQPTTIAGPKAKPMSVAPPASRAGEGRVDAAEQRARDSDARKILEAELSKEQAALADMKRDYNNGEPERHGDERNAQRYLDRIAGMKAAIDRKEADVAAIKRELAKLPG